MNIRQQMAGLGLLSALGRTSKYEKPRKIGAFKNEPCWIRTNDHRIKRPHSRYFALLPATWLRKKPPHRRLIRYYRRSPAWVMVAAACTIGVVEIPILFRHF